MPSDGSFPGSLGIYAQANWEKIDFFKGQMSNVMVYNKALNSQEVENLTSQIAMSLSIPKPSYSATEHFPTLPVVFAFVVVAFLVAGLLVYTKKQTRKNSLVKKP